MWLGAPQYYGRLVEYKWNVKAVVCAHPCQDMGVVSLGSVYSNSQVWRTEYNYCIWLRLCSQDGCGAYDKYGLELAKGELEEKKIERKIR